MNDKLIELYQYLNDTPFEQLQWEVLNKLDTAIFLDDDFDALPDEVDTVIHILDYDVLDNWEMTDKTVLRSDLTEVKQVLQKYLSGAEN